MNQPERDADGNPDTLTADQVSRYLHEHPDFFSDNLELLEILQIPHQSGAAVSLVEKQLRIFRERNEKLSQQLNVLVQIARDNDDLFQKMHKLTLSLLEAQSFDDALISLDAVLHEYFKADFVSIRILKNDTISISAPAIIHADDERLKCFESILESGRPKCGPPDPGQIEFFNGDGITAIRSCAFIPMCSGNFSALMGIGSLDENRFLPTMGHLFLTQMGELVGFRLNSLLDTET